MNEIVGVLNELLTDIFNDILKIERNAIEDTSNKELSIAEMHTIEAIGMYKPRNMTEVAADLSITVGTLTTAVNNLVKKGYVERKRIEEDRRIVLIQLSRKGKLAYRMHEKFHTDMINVTMDGLSLEEEQVLVKALQKLNNFFKDNYSLNSKELKDE